MDSASSHAYVSKNFMDAYLKKKQKIQEKEFKKQLQQLQQPISSAAFLGGG